MNTYKLKELLTIKNGRDHKDLKDGDIPVYGSGGLMRHVDTAIYNEESILLPRKGTLSNIQYVNTPFWTVDTIYYTEVNESKANPFYLYNYLTMLDLSNLNSGTGVPSMTFSSYYDIDVKLPSLEEQNSISKVLSSLDSKIELNNQINQQLEEMAKTIYDYWFVQFDFPDEEGKPYKSSGGKMVYNKQLKREIPEGWEVKTIEDYCPSTGGFAFKSSWWTDYGVKVVKIKNIQEDNTIDINDLDKVDISDKNVDERFMAAPGDVLIAMTGATIGKYGVVPISDTPIYVNQRVGHFKLADKSLSKLPFLINSMHQEYFRESIFAYAGGAAQPNISNEQINKIPLIYPKDRVVDDYNALLLSSYETILNTQYENQQLASLRDWLLPMLMNGQVMVGEE